MRRAWKVTSSCLLLLYLGLTIVGAGHGSCAHEHGENGHNASSHDHAHGHFHACKHNDRAQHGWKQTDTDAPHSCLLCNWLGQAQVADGDEPQRLALLPALASISPSSRSHLRDVNGNALPRGPPTDG